MRELAFTLNIHAALQIVTGSKEKKIETIELYATPYFSASEDTYQHCKPKKR
jgi:hypothetical protein